MTSRAEARAKQLAELTQAAMQRFGVDDDLEGWAGAAATLETDGWTVDFASKIPPVRLYGTLPTGENYFLRGAASEIILGVGGDDPAQQPEWITAVPMRDGSYLPTEEATDLAMMMIQRYIDRAN